MTPWWVSSATLGALRYAGKKFLGVGLIIGGFIFGASIAVMSLIRPEAYGSIPIYVGAGIFIVAAVFGGYFIKTADREL